ncbi:MAG: hypothetical protein RIQ47_1005 [Bacteroidota bacterium]|jgi:caffeoyl-CoA O-methyltransferase
MEFLPEDLSRYVEAHSAKEPDHLRSLNRETYSKVLMPRMLSGHLQGRILSMISKMIQPERILEIGTFTGYSALCLAEGLKEGGSLHTIDINDELAPMVQRYIESAGMSNKIHCYWGNALDIIPIFDSSFDLVFIDADKINYLKYYEMVLPKVRAGGWIIADNVLWSGKILDPASKMDADTAALHHFNEIVSHDSRVTAVLLPVRDGLMLLQKNV